MLHHLLKPQSKYQTRVTCIWPKTLIEKHESFIHGNLIIDDRRVVLDDKMLGDVADITCVEVKNVLEQVSWVMKA